MKEPDKNDFDLSKKFFTSTFGRMFSMLYSIRQHLDAKGFKCIGNNPSDKSMVYREGCVISDWRWLDNNRNLYIGWGIRFSKDASDWWRPFNRLPEKPHAFVYFSYDKKPIFFSDLNLNEEIWNYVDGHKDCVTAVELEGLPKGEETTSQAAIKWIVRNVIEAKSLLRNAER